MRPVGWMVSFRCEFDGKPTFLVANAAGQKAQVFHTLPTCFRPTTPPSFRVDPVVVRIPRAVAAKRKLNGK